MASPVDAGRQDYDGSTALSSHSVTLPGSIASGDLLVMIARVPTATTINTPSGWTALVDNSALTVNDHTSILYRWADGSEGSTQTVSLGGTVKLCAITWRVTGAANPATQAPEVSSAVSSDVGNPNPASLSPTGGSKDYLWLWMAGWEGEETSPPTGNPTNYSNTVGGDTGTGGATAGNCRVAGASRQTTASSEDAPAWTTVSPGGWTAWTVAIHPGAAVTTLSPASLTRTRAQGTPVVSPQVLPQGQVRTRAVGTPVVSPQVLPAGLARTRALGSPVAAGTTTLMPTGLARTRALGSPSVVWSVSPAGLARTRAQGTPTVSPQLLPASLARTRALGTPSAIHILSPASIARTRALGTPTVSPSVLPAGLARSRGLGSLSVGEPGAAATGYLELPKRGVG